ncbi:hypothetical protein [Anaerobiospirillum succiniciproducens]|uniref:hypothetical protein n=1 Tax=Anaerobiospirillum succiniciproducens TaxID=13335 RepID=UPI002355A775|nr:hypothetical protein [Anaerobiospirillum succiniciproducens]MCI6863368.1 hypothetical protein [Anaerobiospirillum succiniciproducens]
MASDLMLQHVCKWTEHGWQPTTPEAEILNSHGAGISSKSCLLLCSLCGQYALLAAGPKIRPHFKHSKSEEIKVCQERARRNNGQLNYDPHKRDLPLRIRYVTKDSFRLELGFIRAPIDKFNHDFFVKIHGKGCGNHVVIYNKERFNNGRITYLDVGHLPYSSFSIELSKDNKVLRQYWPQTVSGVHSYGALFDKETGLMLPYDADVTINKSYYLLKPQSASFRTFGCIEIDGGSTCCNDWVLYEVRALSFDHEAAKFFLQFHCRLTNSPVSFQPLWPLYVEGAFCNKHNSDSLYALVSGHVTAVHSLPIKAAQPLYEVPSGQKVYKINCSDRQMLVTAGRVSILSSTYLWREKLVKDTVKPDALVTDGNNNELKTGQDISLLTETSLHIKINFDGCVVISRDGAIYSKQTLKTDVVNIVHGISYNCSIKILVGFDTIWYANIVYKGKPKQDQLIESDLLRRLNSTHTNLIPTPHAMRNIQAKLKHYPEIQAWIRQRIKCGTMNEHAYRLLQQTCRLEKTEKQERSL